MIDGAPHISFVVPLYNEAESLVPLIRRLDALIASETLAIEVVLVDDGSNDDTTKLIYEKTIQDTHYQGIFLSKNFGHQSALAAGLTYARGTKGVMVIDGDLQDPPELLIEFYMKMQEGYDVVYGVRKNRKEGIVKRGAYYLYYRFQKALSMTPTHLDSGDFSLISRRVVDIIVGMPEEYRYVRGLRSWVGYKQFGVPYERMPRIAGHTKYSFKRLIRLGYDGIFNFSNFPLKCITYLGILTILVSLGYLTHALHKKFVLEEMPEGFTGLLFTIILFGGVQLVCMGILGEYIARIFFQVKGRPRFLLCDHVIDGKPTSVAKTFNSNLDVQPVE